MAKLDGGWIATMFTTDSNLQALTCLASTFGAHLKQLTGSFLVEGLEAVRCDEAWERLWTGSRDATAGELSKLAGRSEAKAKAKSSRSAVSRSSSVGARARTKSSASG